MIGQSAAKAETMMSFGPVNRINGQLGTLILDRTGRIVSCGEPAERIFAGNQSHLIGKGIAEFVTGFCLGGTSPSFSARYLDHLCGEGVWRKFQARDVAGRGFWVELSLAPIITEGQRLFLLHVRCPKRIEGSSPLVSESMAWHG